MTIKPSHKCVRTNARQHKTPLYLGLKKCRKVFAISLSVIFSLKLVLADPTRFISAEFGSQPQALFYIFLMVFWVVFLLMTYNVKGLSGKTVGFFNLLQLLFGLVVGFGLLQFSYMIGFGISFVSVGSFVGLMIYNR